MSVSNWLAVFLLIAGSSLCTVRQTDIPSTNYDWRGIMYPSRSSHTVKNSRRTRPLSFLFGSKSKQQRQIGGEKSNFAEEEVDRDKKLASRTLILSPTSSSRFLLNHDACSSSFSLLDSIRVPSDFELDPVPEMIQIDHKRFHFDDAGGSGRPFDLTSSASICRNKENFFAPDSTGLTWPIVDSLNDRQYGHENGNNRTMMMMKQREIGCSLATPSWSPARSDNKDGSLIKIINKVGLKDSGDQAVDESTGTSDHLLKPSSSSSSSRSIDQVVDLRVSLHCRGCERKLRKHLSRMKGT